ncbi:MAG TPA: ORF6N domain-containing protein [Bryobacteraceae bacterium]|nr:ORF6N domain-containing protein [Bryobacteraceae bacterium]
MMPKKDNMGEELPVPAELIEQRIFLIRGHKVMVDADLASLYDVPTGALNRAVKRNLERFPEDFCFQLMNEELEALRFQSGISKKVGRGGRRYLPYVFTEQGVAMLASVLNSPRAVQVSIGIVRVFVRLRAILATHAELSRRLEELERKFEKHDSELYYVFEAIRELMAPEPVPPKRRIGFQAGPDDSGAIS